MSKGIRFTVELKQDAVAQGDERGYAVSEVAERLGISTKSLYTWKAQFVKSPRVRSEVAEQAAEIMRSMYRVLMVHFSGFSAWLKEPLSTRAREDARQTELIQQA